jgi:hypothetical protein
MTRQVGGFFDHANAKGLLDMYTRAAFRSGDTLIQTTLRGTTGNALLVNSSIDYKE